MKKVSLNNFINSVLFIYILSIYLLTYREGLNIISNTIAFLLVATIWLNFLITKRKLAFNKILLLFLLFILFCIISVFFAIEQGRSVPMIKTLILIYIVMISLVNYIDNLEKIEKTINYFVYSGVITSFYIFAISDFSQITRFGSELGNENAIGMIIGLSATFSFYCLLNKRKFIHIVFLLIMIPTLLLTGSRQALLFLFFNILIMMYLKYRGDIRKTILLIIVSVLLLITVSYIIFNVPFFYQIIGERTEQMVNFISGEGKIDDSVKLRAYMAKSGIEMFKNKPFTGYGINNFRILFNSVPGGRDTYAHNNFIELLVGIGIIGAIIYYLIYFCLLANLLINAKQIAKRDLSYIFIAIIISYIIMSVSTVYYYNKHISFLLAIASTIQNCSCTSSLDI